MKFWMGLIAVGAMVAWWGPSTSQADTIPGQNPGDYLATNPTSYDVQAASVKITYTANTTTGVGEFTAVGESNHLFPYGTYPNGGTAINPVAGSFVLNAYFDLATGNLLTSYDNYGAGGTAGNYLSVTNGSGTQYFLSTSISEWGTYGGSMGQSGFDFTFTNNTGSTSTGGSPSIRLGAGPGLGNPSLTLTGPQSFESSTSGVVWQNAGVGSANVWSPTPKGLWGGLVLMAALAAAGMMSRTRRSLHIG